LALQGKFKAGDKILDIGSGEGRALRYITRFTNANVIGITNNAAALARSKRSRRRLAGSGTSISSSLPTSNAE
ncbi:MAG: class I SAM-dependent methyltransferase, partial [Bdellovibrionota bacterium]